ncbi:MAG: DNA polymerase III subunit delta [Clostridia bacterium]|nr:DNA polymerase III subunit delta [Clostridia bacterium]
MKMTWKELFGEIEAGPSGVYLFYGPESYVKEEALQKMRQRLLPAGLEALNEDVMEGEGAQRITEAAQTLPMMAEKRLVVVRDFPSLLPGKAKVSESDTDRLIEYVKSPAETAVLVFYVRESIDGRTKLVQALVRHGKCVEFDYLQEGDLMRRLVREARNQGARMDENCAAFLVDRAGQALGPLLGEVRKLAAHAGTNGEILRADVERLVAPSSENTVFQMIDALMSGRGEQAFVLLHRLLESGESRVGVIAMLTRQMRILTHVKLLSDARVTLPEIAKRLSLRDFAVRNAQKQASSLPKETLIGLYRTCIEMDYAFKSGRMRDGEALDQLMFRIAGIKG